MRRWIALAVLWAAFLGAGCTRPSPETFTFLGDQEVEFIRPPRSWEMSTKEERMTDASGREVNAVVAVTFDRPGEEQGTLSVKTGGRIQNKEIDEDLVKLLRQRLTDDRWHITEFQWLSVDGEKAYALDFEYEAEAGRQVHFIHGGYAWSIVMVCPKEYTKDTRGNLDRLVESFRFRGSPTPAQTP